MAHSFECFRSKFYLQIGKEKKRVYCGVIVVAHVPLIIAHKGIILIFATF